MHKHTKQIHFDLTPSVAKLSKKVLLINAVCRVECDLNCKSSFREKSLKKKLQRVKYFKPQNLPKKTQEKDALKPQHRTRKLNSVQMAGAGAAHFG